MTCAMPRYENEEVARAGRRKLIRNLHARPSIQFCETCDAYHLALDKDEQFFNPRWKKIGELLAQGFTTAEIAVMLNINRHTIFGDVENMKRRLYALSIAHLVVIMVMLGIIRPSEFIPDFTESEHA